MTLPNGNALSQFINVSQPVGIDWMGGVNLPDDVSAVQGLIQIVTSAHPEMFGGFPTVTGRFDPMTGYYIVAQQLLIRSVFPNTIVDGVVSPAPQSGGIHYASGGIWTIYELNEFAAAGNYAAWQALVEKYAQNAPGA